MKNSFSIVKCIVTYEYEDMKDMDWDYGSLNLINIRNKYEVFMSKLPNPLKDGRGKFFIGD